MDISVEFAMQDAFFVGTGTFMKAYSRGGFYLTVITCWPDCVRDPICQHGSSQIPSEVHIDWLIIGSAGHATNWFSRSSGSRQRRQDIRNIIKDNKMKKIEFGH